MVEVVDLLLPADLNRIKHDLFNVFQTYLPQTLNEFMHLCSCSTIDL